MQKKFLCLIDEGVGRSHNFYAVLLEQDDRIYPLTIGILWKFYIQELLQSKYSFNKIITRIYSLFHSSYLKFKRFNHILFANTNMWRNWNEETRRGKCVYQWSHASNFNYEFCFIRWISILNNMVTCIKSSIIF